MQCSTRTNEDQQCFISNLAGYCKLYNQQWLNNVSTTATTTTCAEFYCVNLPLACVILCQFRSKKYVGAEKIISESELATLSFIIWWKQHASVVSDLDPALSFVPLFSTLCSYTPLVSIYDLESFVGQWPYVCVFLFLLVVYPGRIVGERNISDFVTWHVVVMSAIRRKLSYPSWTFVLEFLTSVKFVCLWCNCALDACRCACVHLFPTPHSERSCRCLVHNLSSCSCWEPPMSAFCDCRFGLSHLLSISSW